MAINKNHLFEDLDGIKCAIVEAPVTPERKEFLSKLLELNGYTVVAVPLAPPAAKTQPAATEGADNPVEEPAAPQLYKVGVTDVAFNPTNAIFGRMLRTQNGRIVTMAYWLQQEDVSHDEIPYFERDLSR